MQPLRDYVLVKPETPDATYGSSLLIVPDAFKQRKQKGIIAAIGQGTVSEPMKLKTGMTVFNIKDCGVPVDIDGEEYFLMKQRDVLATD